MSSPTEGEAAAGRRRERLFFALWPDPELRRRLAELGRRYAPAEARRVAPADLHLTLAFVGGCDAARRACLERVAAGVRAAPLRFCLDRIGYWARPRVLWLGAARQPAALRALAERLQQALGACDHPPDERPFRAHVTLARKVRQPLAARLEPPLCWHAERFCLVRSRTTPAGVHYQVVRDWPLRP